MELTERIEKLEQRVLELEQSLKPYSTNFFTISGYENIGRFSTEIEAEKAFNDYKLTFKK